MKIGTQKELLLGMFQFRINPLTILALRPIIKKNNTKHRVIKFKSQRGLNKYKNDIQIPNND